MHISINGKIVNTGFSLVHELKESCYPTSDITIINGYQSDENLALKENDEITFIKKGEMPDETALEKMMRSRNSPEVYEKVKASSVAVAGLGGLGSHIAINLARVGVGQLLLVDFDLVEPSNLNRQSYYIRHLGMYKTEALKEQIQQINPYINVECICRKITPENAASIFEGYKIVCEALDGAAAKAMLINTLLAEAADTYIIAGSGMAGYESSNSIKTWHKMQRLYVCGDLASEAQIGRGLMAPRVNICAAHQANMALRLLLGIEKI